MTSSTHPSYPNPTIQEAICEIHFRLQEGASWNANWYGEFFKRVEKEFPTLQPVAPSAFRIHIGPGREVPVPQAAPQVMRYQHTARPLLLQLSEGRIVVNTLPRYAGWAQMSKDIAYAWENTCELINPSNVTRIGLRYINRIERSTADEKLEAWLVPNEYIPSKALASEPGFFVRVQVRLDNSNRINITVADEEPPPESYGGFVIDIDRICEQEISTDSNHLLDEANQLHEDVWEVFRSAKGERLEKLLQGDLL
jgi:uncharacterized protein (TIGR04255 family)